MTQQSGHSKGYDETQPVLRACLFCRAPLPRHDAAAHITVGRRVAFDPRRGRLWIVCDACGRWNLTPFESRWEALEELERLATGRARLLASTDNIALIEAGPLQLVRVGPTTLREEAWWRYGTEIRGREERAAHARKWGKVLDAGLALLTIGIPIWGWRDPEHHVERLRRGLYGRHAWPERMYCQVCGKLERGLLFEDTGNLRLTRDAAGSLRLWVDCDRCGRGAYHAGYTLAGDVAEHVLRRVLAYRNFVGAPAWQIDRAAGIVADAGSGAALTHRLAADGTYLSLLRSDQSLALEIAVNEQRERELLLLEAAALEERWLEEERIAAIIDGELS